MNALPATKILLLTALAAAEAVWSAPVVISVQNAASNMRSGLPNSGIARGAAFAVKGVNLGPPDPSIATVPLPTTQAGTSIKIVIGDRTVDVPIQYSFGFQVGAIVPSSVPAGEGKLTVTYKGETSEPYPILIVDNNIGVFTMDSTGIGRAVATRADGSVITDTNAPNPGDVVVLWGTGLGPISSDDSMSPPGGDMTEVPVEAFVGNRPAAVLYRGRNSCCTALDQINIRIPEGVTGCDTPIALLIRDIPSNSVTLPIAANGRVCVPNGLPPEEVAKMRSQATYSIGTVSLTRIAIGDIVGAGVIAGFARYRASDALRQLAALGFCAASGNQVPGPSVGIERPTYLDAGPSVTLETPTGPRVIAKDELGSYQLIPFVGGLPIGEYSMTATGGTNVGPFTARITLPPMVQWGRVTTASRARGLTLTWTGAAPESILQISGGSSGTVGELPLASFQCHVSAAEGQFTIPPHVLLALPAGPRGTLTMTMLSSRPFTASGVDSAVISHQETVQFQGIIWE